MEPSTADEKKDKGKKKEKEKEFRLTARNLFLTYPNCSASPESVLSALREIITAEIEEYVIATEDHQSGEQHVHCYLKLSRKVNYRDPQCLDLKFYDSDDEEVIYHGNYQTVRSIDKTIAYVKKHGVYISNLLDFFDQVKKCETRQQLLELIVSNKKIHQSKFIQEYWSLSRPRTEIDYEYECSWNDLALRVLEQCSAGQGRRPRGLFIHGKPGCGKTTWVRKNFKATEVFFAYEPKHFTHYRDEPIICLDEFNLELWTTGFINGLITDPNILSPAYYGSVRLKWPRVVIVLSNHNCKDAMQESTRSRFIFLNVTPL